MTSRNLGLTDLPSNSLQPSVTINDGWQILDAACRPNFIIVDKDLTTPPVTTGSDVGKVWIPASGATGAWSGKAGQPALCTAANAWRFFTPAEGWKAYVLDENAEYTHDGSAWVAGSGIASVTSVNGATGAVTLTAGDIVAAINDETASYTAVLSDEVVIMDNASANNFTVPPNSSVAFPIGCFLEVWQKGAGQTTIVAGSGVTILYHADLTLKLKGQNSGCSLRKVATDTWRLIGDMEPA